MDEIILRFNLLSNTWLDYIRKVEFTEEEEDQINDKIQEIAELMNEFYEGHCLEEQNG